MGQQGMDKSVCVIVVDQVCESDQLLVSLCKNGAEWLSPIGWTGQKKVTLLDCRSKGEQTEIDIPQDYAATLMSGDVLTLSCSELDLKQEIIWDRSDVLTRDIAAPSAAGVSGMASSLLSRFKGNTIEAEVVGSEAERRAKDAERAAQSYKEKMEAATAAKEEAHRAALNAAREAENALKMEAERIAEMERAAKAFEEAERLKQDELRRVDEERRLEEERRAEEKRRIEAARKREEAARREAARKAALDRYQVGLDAAQNDTRDLVSRLGDLRGQASELEQNRADMRSDHETAVSSFEASAQTVEKRSASYEKIAAKLEGVTSQQEEARAQSETLLSQRDALAHKLTELELDYQSAQKAAEAAMAIAAEKRAELTASQENETLLSQEITTARSKLDAQNDELGNLTEKAELSHKRFQDAELSHSQLSAQLETFETEMLGLADRDQSLRHEIETTQQAIEDTQSLERRHNRAIIHLESGGDPDDIDHGELQTESFEAASSSLFGAEQNTDESWVSRARKSFARKADAQISIDVDDVELDAAPVPERPTFQERLNLSERLPNFGEVLPSLSEKLPNLSDKRPSLPAFMSASAVKSMAAQNRSSVMAIGAVLAGVAIIGTGYAVNKNAPQQIVKAQPPTQVASATATATAKPKAVLSAPDAPRAETIADTKLENSTAAKLEKIEIATPEIAIEKPAVKIAALKPTKPALKEAAISTQQVKPIKALEKTAAKPKLNKKARNYPEVTRDIQERLSALGYYQGDFDGLQNKDTLKAVREFKQLYDMPANDAFTGQFLSKLKQTQQAQKLEQAVAVKTASAPNVEVYDYAQPVPVEPVWTDSLPAASPAPYVEPAPAPAPIQVAAAPIQAEPVIAPAIADVITPSKVIKNAGASYPAKALRREYYKKAVIILSYDINTQGKAENIQISSNDNTSRYADAFEQEAIKMLEDIRFSPKLVNNTPVVDADLTQRIVFQVQ